MVAEPDTEAELAEDAWTLAVGQEFAEALTSEMETFRRLARVKRAQAGTPVQANEIFVQKARNFWVVWLGSRIMGRITFPIHWDPPCVSGHCMHPGHGPNCRLSVPIRGTGTDELVVNWIAQQDSFLTREAHHRAAGPAGPC